MDSIKVWNQALINKTVFKELAGAGGAAPVADRLVCDSWTPFPVPQMRENRTLGTGHTSERTPPPLFK